MIGVNRSAGCFLGSIATLVRSKKQSLAAIILNLAHSTLTSGWYSINRDDSILEASVLDVRHTLSLPAVSYLQ